MKILLDHQVPFRLAHGGAQTQILETYGALRKIGIEVEPLRWWDPDQRGDLIHSFGLPSALYSRMARIQRTPVVSTVLLTSTCNHPVSRLRFRGLLRTLLCRVPGGALFRNQTHWADYGEVNRLVVGLEAESQALELLYGVAPSRIVRVPLGMSEAFLGLPDPPRDGDYLVTTGTITDRKRSKELALMAREAEVPILFVGKPYRESESYWQEFRRLIDGRFVRHLPHVESAEEMIPVLRSARGFVIYSRHENWCLSAHEAAACGLPLLVQDQPWSRERFGGEARYLRDRDDGRNAVRLKEFHREAPAMGRPQIVLPSWTDVASRLAALYRELLPG